MSEKKYLIKDIKTYDPAKVPDEVLLDDFRLITAKYATMAEGGKTEFASIDDVVKMGTRIIQEIVKRGTITFHPGRMKPMALELFRKSLLAMTKRGLYLVPPHAEAIHRGKKTAVVKSRKFNIENFVYLCSGDLCYGIIRLWKPQRLSLTQFANKKGEHKVSEEERRTWWPGKGWLYLYQIREYVPFEKPRKFRRPKGVQTFISDVEWLSRQTPWPQWGGSVKYAKNLASRFPEHHRYVEPFCGAAAVLFRKERSAEEIISDLDGEVAFGLRYIQNLSKKTFDDLKKYSWKASRAGYKRAKECKPSTQAERLWRLIYGRVCAWGGQPRMSGYSTLHDGSVYDLKELWKFKDRLKGVKILREDWKKIVRKYDGKQTLFFADPPYMDEWGTKEGIPPEEIAEVFGKVKGEFAIAYTDSHRALKAFWKIGNVFRLVIQETTKTGIFEKHPRLFVTSFSKRKKRNLGSEELEKGFSYEETNPTALSNADLIRAHAWVHARWEASERGEPTINFHVLVLKELRRRGMEHRPWTELDEKSLPLIEMAEGTDGNLVYYDEVAKIWPHGFELRKPLLSLIGSIPVQGFGRDIDLHVNWNPEDQNFLRALEFRLRSFMPEHLKDRLHLVPDQDGPFTSFIPIANLRIEMLPLGQRLLQTMAMEDKDLQRVISEKVEKEAKASIKEDKIKHFRFFRHLKGIVGYKENEVYSIPGLLEVLKERDYPYIVDQKYDGARVKIDKMDIRIKITSEDGGDWTDRFPTFIEELAEMQDDVILDAEITGIDPKTGAHIGRSDVAGYAHAKTPPDDSPFRANVFTILMLNGKDAHKETELGRKNILDALAKESFKKDGKVRAIDWRLAKNEKEMKAAVKHFSDLKYSEGAMIKASRGTYPLTGHSPRWIKYKIEVTIDGEVIQVNKVKGAMAWNYLCIIRDDEKKPTPVGRTYTTKIGRVKGKEPLKIGDILRVAVVNVNRYTDPKTGEIWFNWWSPRPIAWREDLLEPDSVERVNEFVKITRGEVGEKRYPARYRKILGELQRLNLQREYPKYSFVMQHHWRGKSCHLDFRRKVNAHLEGETILDQPKEAVRYPVETMDAAADAERRVKWKFDPKMDPTKHVLVTGKAKQPLVWLGIEGIVEKGEIGATKEFVGVFYISDRGSYMPGVQKAYFKEFFLYGTKRFKNGLRMVERLIETRAKRGAEEEDEGRPPTGGPLVWETWITEEDRPYLLTLRGRRRRDYVPPQGVSALNERWEKLVKPEFRWWIKKGLSRKEALNMMDRAFNDLVARGILPHRPIPVGGEKRKQARRKFVLQRRWWKGQVVVRGMPVDFFDLRIDLGIPDYLLTFTFPLDPTIAESQATILEKWKDKTPDGKPFKNWLTFEGEIPPLHKLNPNKKLSATVKILDKGEVDVIERTQDFISFRFRGKIMKGIWIARREAPDAPVWVFERGELPKATK